MFEIFKQILRGLCMGAADVVPGVSGGTVALLLGIYTRLVHAITRFDIELIKLIAKRKWREAWHHADLGFVSSLAAGILSGVVLTSFTIHSLLSSPVARPFTLAVFFGMIAASGVLVLLDTHKKISGWPWASYPVALLGLLIAASIAWLEPSQTSDGGPALWYVFVCATIAICAMILPGISGAMILLLLGLYGTLTAIPHELKDGENLTNNLIILVVFACGCACGLGLFSRLLRWLLVNHLAVTMAGLCGLMFGSLPKLWPFQLDHTPEVIEFEDKHLTPIMPESLDGIVFSILGAMLLAALFVLTAHFFATQNNRLPDGNVDLPPSEPSRNE